MEFESKIVACAREEPIGFCGSNLDALITAGTQQNEALETYKKVLISQLFPFLDLQNTL